jgi:hypothetical protein
MSAKTILKHIFGYILALVPWAILLSQSTLNWIEFANAESARYFGLGMILISSLGVGFLPNGGWMHSVKYFSLALITQLIIFLIGGSFGLLDANAEGLITEGTYNLGSGGMWYALDGLSGLSTAVGALEWIVGLIAKIVPIFVIVWGIIGILTADSPDEYTSPLIETGIGIVMLAVFYGIGSLVGFI